MHNNGDKQNIYPCIKMKDDYTTSHSKYKKKKQNKSNLEKVF